MQLNTKECNTVEIDAKDNVKKIILSVINRDKYVEVERVTKEQDGSLYVSIAIYDKEKVTH